MLFTLQKSKAASKPNLKSGFTLFEMLVSLAIIAIVSGIVFYNHSQFRSDVEITNLAYQIALSAREAQVKSVSVRQRNVGGTFDVFYGLHFSFSVPNAYILFADTNGDGLYTTSGSDDMECEPGSTSECIEKITLGRGNVIKNWCKADFDPNTYIDGGQCVFTDGVNGSSINYLDIVFKRPNPDAVFNVFDIYPPQTANVEFCPPNEFDSPTCNAWAICLSSPADREKKVIVYDTGQISVENVEPDGADFFCH